MTNESSAAKWNKMIDLLDEANSLQQGLFSKDEERISYDFHDRISNLMDDLIDAANRKGIDIG